jgi:nudix-type nucleoside diphosphatase (YffH/AdpP family)
MAVEQDQTQQPGAAELGKGEQLPNQDAAAKGHRREARYDPPKRMFNGFFKIDQYKVKYRRYDGKMTECTRLNFERGDAVGVLIFNVDTRSVVLVEQFKLPTLIGRQRDDPKTQDGWIEETMAGMIRDGEKPEDAAIRETEEETGYIIERTGYKIENPKLICKFLSSPGGTSERIFLYFAQVREALRKEKEKKDIRGVEDEDIKVVHIGVNDLFAKLENGEIDDPKLVIAVYWLKENLANTEIGSLDPDTVEYAFVDPKKSDLIIGYKQGDIRYVNGVDVWVNGENSDMMMDRFAGQSLSARIRAMGANRDGNVVVDDTIQEALRGLMGDRDSVDIRQVLVTESGMLRNDNGVQRILHVAVVKGSLGTGFQPKVKDLCPCVESVLKELEHENKRLIRRLSGDYLESVLFPLIGAGEGGLPIQIVVKEIIPVAINYFNSAQNPTVKKIYFLAFRLRERDACDKLLERYCEQGVLRRLPKTAAPDGGRLETMGGQAF